MQTHQMHQSVVERFISKVLSGSDPQEIIEEYTDDAAINELNLYIDNNEPLYRQKQACFKNLTVKKAQGRYDASLAPKLFMYLIDAATKAYAKEFSVKDGNEALKLDKESKQKMAQELVQEFEEMHEEGDFNQYVPKKYASKAPAKKEYDFAKLKKDFE